MTPAEAYTIVGLISAGVGLVSGIAVGAWTVSAKNKDLEAHGKAIDSIAAKCDRQKDLILSDLKAAVCDTINIALRDLKSELREKQSSTERELAVVAERVSQAERDIDNIFNRLRELEKEAK